MPPRDTPTPPVPPHTFKGGTLSSSDFALPLSEDLLRRNIGAPVSAAKAREIIEARLNAASTVKSGEVRASSMVLAELIVKGLPDEAMNDAIVSSLDLRPYVQVIVDSPTLETPVEHKGVNLGFATGGAVLTHMQDIMDGLQAQEVNFAVNAAQVDGKDPGAATRAATSFTRDTVGVPASMGGDMDLSKGSNPADEPSPYPKPSGDGTTPVAPSNAIDLGNAPTGTSEPTDTKPGFQLAIESPTWDPAGFRSLFDSGIYSLGDLAQGERPTYKTVPAQVITPADGSAPYEIPAHEEIDPTVPYGPMGIQVSGAPPTPRVTDIIPGQTPRTGIGVVPALTFLTNKTEKEITALQDKMEQAGLLTKGDYLRGWAQDDKTHAAWVELISESFKRNVPTDQVVKERAAYVQRQKGYEEQQRQVQNQKLETDVRAARRRALQTQDPNDVRAVANDYSRSMIGRDLTPAELLKLGAFVGDLQRKAATDFAHEPVFTAASPGPGLGDVPTEKPTVDPYLGFTQGDVTNYVGSQLGDTEAMQAYSNGRQAALKRFGSASPEEIAKQRAAIYPHEAG